MTIQKVVVLDRFIHLPLQFWIHLQQKSIAHQHIPMQHC